MQSAEHVDQERVSRKEFNRDKLESCLDVSSYLRDSSSLGGEMGKNSWDKQLALEEKNKESEKARFLSEVQVSVRPGWLELWLEMEWGSANSNSPALKLLKRTQTPCWWQHGHQRKASAERHQHSVF